MPRDIERYTLPDHNPIQPLDLEALRVLKQAASIGGQEVDPLIDVAYVLQVMQEMTDKLNEVIARQNDNNYNEKIQVVGSKLNQVVTRLNQHFKDLAKTLTEEVEELKELE